MQSRLVLISLLPLLLSAPTLAADDWQKKATEGTRKALADTEAYINCVDDNAISFASSTHESAGDIADASAGKCASILTRAIKDMASVYYAAAPEAGYDAAEAKATEQFAKIKSDTREEALASVLEARQKKPD